MYPDVHKALGRVSPDVLPGEFWKRGWERSQVRGSVRGLGSSALALCLQCSFFFMSSLNETGKGHTEANPTVS